MQFKTVVSFEAPNNDVGAEIMLAIGSLLEGRGVKATLTHPEPPKLKDGELVIVHTDGGYSSANDMGSWAYTIQIGDNVSESFGAFQATTNNRMELLAVIRALEEIEPGQPVIVYSDSQYVINGISSWVHGWVKRGWKTGYGDEVKNRDLWEVLLGLTTVHAVVFKHVKGHNGNEFNERCDHLCTQAIAQAIAAKKAGLAVESDK